jgi:arginyl-tRNA synthetase
MVALTPRCAEELGYAVSDGDKAKPYIEVSGRKGFGVKADDLIDKLIAAVQPLVNEKQSGSPEPFRQQIATQIALGALRYFMLKYTRNSVIAFDFKDALSFEGETGPYIQYAVVRIRNIFRKAGTTAEAVIEEFAKSAGQQVSESASQQSGMAAFLSGEQNEDIWALWLRAGRFSLVFANFYHRHHILTEEDPARKTFLLATAAVALRELVRSLALLGIESPEAM